jgi:hypothetical protein
LYTLVAILHVQLSLLEYIALTTFCNNNNKKKKQSYRWLKFADVKGETESVIMAAQDQAISTKYFKKKILKQEIGSRC